jgi:two-component system cell cycle response regulator
MTTEVSLQAKSVLIVDDNPTNLKLTRFLLDKEGYRVLTATDGLEAIELLQTVQPDLVLMDIQLPGIDGLEVTRRLKSDPATCELTIVALSAYMEESNRTQVREVGCDGFISKPIDTKTFPGLVREYMNRAGPKQIASRTIATIVLAEDDTGVRNRLSQTLREAGYAVTTVVDGAQALEVTERDRPDLVLSDILMPRLDGFRLCAAVRGNPELDETHVILTTSGATRETDRTLARRKGATCLVPKTDPALILDRIREAQSQPPGTVEPEGGESMDTIRQAFLMEGREQISKLVRTEPEDWDVGEARQIAHRMAGTGGTLGYPQISQTAFQLERILEGDHFDSRGINQAVADLERLFDQLEQTATREQLPDRVQAAIKSRKFVLVGFSRSEDRRLSRAIEHAGGFCRVQESLPAPDDPCDLAIISIRALPSPEDPDPGPWPSIIVGPASRLSSIHRTSMVDLLVAPADAAEVLVRSYHLLTRSRQERDESDDPETSEARVLVVDDDPTITALLKSTLTHAGMRCQTADSGPDALEQIQQFEPHAIVLDVNLPGMDGFEVLSTLKNDKSTASIPVLMLTARQQESDVLRGFALGVADYVVKPFSPMEVAARLGRLLR